jgi:CAAX protease family protein
VAAAAFGLPVALAALLAFSSPLEKFCWQDATVLAVLIATYMLRLLANAWPYPSLTALSKLYIADVALYLYLVVRGLKGMGYSFTTRDSFLIGLREWFYFLPFGIGLGAALKFIHLHSVWPSPLRAAETIVVTFLLIAIPEEMFFRGILQNLLETRVGRKPSLFLTAILFGLAHFNKGAVFNWRYVLLATIAGVFYGRAWRERRQLLASVITHAAVDVVWSLCFR